MNSCRLQQINRNKHKPMNLLSTSSPPTGGVCLSLPLQQFLCAITHSDVSLTVAGTSPSDGEASLQPRNGVAHHSVLSSCECV